MLELLYSGECPICRSVAGALACFQLTGVLLLIPIESPRGQGMVKSHHGEYVHAPHLFTPERVYYGIGPVAKGLATELPKSLYSRYKPW